MSTYLLRNNLNKLYYKSYQLTKNLKLMSNTVGNRKTFKLLQNHLINPNIFRYLSSKSLIIKEYKSSRKYTITWKLERLAGWSLIILIPMAFAIESKELEIALSVAALLHAYWGCQSMCSDYLRSGVVGKLLPVIVRVSVVLLTLASFVGVYQLIYNDIGLINMIKEIWSIRGSDYVPPKYLDKVE